MQKKSLKKRGKFPPSHKKSCKKYHQKVIFSSQISVIISYAIQVDARLNQPAVK
jgi:hypothetical protein